MGIKFQNLRQFTYIDLFAGCGGLSLGLHLAGWKGLFAIEKNKDAFQTLHFNLVEKLNHFDWVDWLPVQPWEINEVIQLYRKQLKSIKGEVDMVVGGPPCQGFSFAGRRVENDVRNNLIESYIEFISLVRPKIIFFENVKGFTLRFEKNRTRGVAYANYVLDKLDKLHYDVEGRMVDFSEYGIPQKRARFILIGIQRNIKVKNNYCAKDFFSLLQNNKMNFLGEKGLSGSNITLEQAISDLLAGHGQADTPDRKPFKSGLYGILNSDYQKIMRDGINTTIPDSHSFANHSLAVKTKFKEILNIYGRNKNIGKQILREKYKTQKHSVIPLEGKSPTPTLTTLPDDFIHYCEPRILTVREYARIQSFPDWFEFKGKYTTGGKDRVNDVPRYTQIGNAIPPFFGEQSGLVLKQLL